MDVKGLVTKRSGKISIHMGRGKLSASTNAWDAKGSFGWYTVTDKYAVEMLNDIVRNELSIDTAKAVLEFIEKYPVPDAIGEKKFVGTFIPKKARESTEEPKTESEPTVVITIPTKEPNTEEPKTEEQKEDAERFAKIAFGKKLIEFFKEFNFSPSRRFVNTLKLQGNLMKAIEYVKNYFFLQDHPDAQAIAEKVKSLEFKELLSQLYSFKSFSPKINNRLVIFFGDPGGGKTTQAKAEYPSARLTICHEGMESEELLSYIKVDGDHTAEYPSALMEDIQEGRVHILDEINLLPYKTLRFLQGLTDGKDTFEYKGSSVKIGEGFKIIGTMNLKVNGQVVFLPDPLVDRAEELREFPITAEAVAESI